MNKEIRQLLKIKNTLTAWQGNCPHNWKELKRAFLFSEQVRYQYQCQYCGEIEWFSEDDYDDYAEFENENYNCSEKDFFDLFTWSKEQDWSPDFVAFCNSAYRHGLERIIEYINNGGGFANGEYWNFPIELVDLNEFPKMLYLFKIHYLHNQKRSLNAKRDIDEED